MVEGNFTRIAAPAESIHNDLLYSSYLEIIEVELCGGPSCNILWVVVGEVGCPKKNSSLGSLGFSPSNAIFKL